MTMTTTQLKKRLDAIDPHNAGPRECTCKDRIRIVHEGGYIPPDAADPGPEICPVCGGERITIVIEHVKDWRP